MIKIALKLLTKHGLQYSYKAKHIFKIVAFVVLLKILAYSAAIVCHSRVSSSSWEGVDTGTQSFITTFFIG